MSVPTFEKLFNPLITAMHNLGGSAKNEEIESEVAKILNLSDKDIAEIHRGNRTKLSYRLAWARNYLKRAGLINNSSRGVWYLTSEGLKIQNVNNKDIVNKARNNGITKDVSVCSNQDSDSELVIEQDTWEDKLLSILKRMDPFAFERLSQRLLKEAGFENVEVTKKSGDGGIDGKGILKIGGLVSFNVYFQSKRYEGTVSSSIVRDFRGAIVGRADKGIIITTGMFSKDAKIEARRDGTLMIDLIDGIELAHKLKEYNLGVNIIEQIEIEEDWFNHI
ncbi:MAG: restriction endonuclease [Alphaproteobacteria bacterium]|nr:restriction endonuclease [Alphaproteobacteria bacterium]